MKRTSIKTKEPFEGLFPIENHILNTVIEDMKANGYDLTKRIIIWKGKNICIDGHTRLMAAEAVGLNYVKEVLSIQKIRNISMEVRRKFNIIKFI